MHCKQSRKKNIAGYPLCILRVYKILLLPVTQFCSRDSLPLLLCKFGWFWFSPELTLVNVHDLWQPNGILCSKPGRGMERHKTYSRIFWVECQQYKNLMSFPSTGPVSDWICCWQIDFRPKICLGDTLTLDLEVEKVRSKSRLQYLASSEGTDPGYLW